MKTTARKAILIAASLALILTLGFGSTWANEPDTTQDANFYVSVSAAENLQIIPGFTQANNTSVSLVNNKDVSCYLFVQITNKSGGLITYDIADGWTPLTGYDGVYYRTIMQSAEQLTFPILNSVTYSQNIKVSDMDGLSKALTFKAYMISKAGEEGDTALSDAQTAWDIVSTSSTSTTTP